jgi:hypothetical protein
MTIREILDLHPEVQGEERAQILCRDEIGILGCCFHGPYDNNPKKYREALFETIRSGEVRMTIIQLPEPIPRWQRFTGHEKHQRSCGSVAAWIESIGREWDKSTGTGEVYSKAGSRADLQTVDGKLTVEVGLTKVDGVMQCLELGVEVLLVPHVTLGLFGLLLTPLPDKRLFVQLREEEREAILRACLSRHTPYVSEVEGDDD